MAIPTSGLRAARVLHGRWRRLSREERARLEPLARDVKELALDLRGEPDRERAERTLEEANRRLADAMSETPSADSELSEAQLRDLREDLARELERLASAEIRATRAGDAGRRS